MNRIELSDDEWDRLRPKIKKLPGIQVGYLTPVDGLLVRLCGYYVRGRSGECYRQLMVNGTASSSDFRGGAPLAPGKNCRVILLNQLINKMFLWMVQ